MSARVRTSLQVGAVVALVIAVFSPSLRAQFSSGGGVGPDLSNYVTTAAMSTAVTDMQTVVMAAMPQPANTAPVADATTAAIGSTTNRYMLPDSVRPARYRSGTCTLSSGVCSLVWSTPFSTTPNPIGDPSVVNTNAASSMIQCNWTAVSTTGASFKCVQPLVALSISLGALTLLPNATNGLVVSGTAVQPL